MRLLVDENLSPRVAAFLGEAGLDAVYVLDRGLGGASDSDVSALAIAEDRAIVSADSDFASMLALSQGTAPSLVLLRSGDQLKPAEQAALPLAPHPSKLRGFDTRRPPGGATQPAGSVGGGVYGTSAASTVA